VKAGLSFTAQSAVLSLHISKSDIYLNELYLLSTFEKFPKNVE
jgi:hypothetical protein